eukprot:3414446-Pyramimonas_sp.AAC.1
MQSLPRVRLLSELIASAPMLSRWPSAGPGLTVLKGRLADVLLQVVPRRKAGPSGGRSASKWSREQRCASPAR